MMQCSIKILVQLQTEFDSKTFFHHPKMGNNHTGGIFTKQAGIIITPLTVASTAHVPFWELFKGILKTAGKTQNAAATGGGKVGMPKYHIRTFYHQITRMH